MALGIAQVIGAVIDHHTATDGGKKHLDHLDHHHRQRTLVLSQRLKHI